MNTWEVLLLIGVFLFILYHTVQMFMYGQYKEQEKNREEHDKKYSNHNVQDPPL